MGKSKSVKTCYTVDKIELMSNVFPDKYLFPERQLVGECLHLDVRTSISVAQLSQLNFLISSDHGWVCGNGWEGTKDRRWVLGVWVRKDQDFYNDTFIH